MLLWKRYVNNKMAAMRFLHLQQYSHRLNLLCFFFTFLETAIIYCVQAYYDNKTTPVHHRFASNVPLYTYNVTSTRFDMCLASIKQIIHIQYRDMPKV